MSSWLTCVYLHGLVMMQAINVLTSLVHELLDYSVMQHSREFVTHVCLCAWTSHDLGNKFSNNSNPRTFRSHWDAAHTWVRDSFYYHLPSTNFSITQWCSIRMSSWLTRVYLQEQVMTSAIRSLTSSVHEHLHYTMVQHSHAFVTRLCLFAGASHDAGNKFTNIFSARTPRWRCSHSAY